MTYIQPTPYQTYKSLSYNGYHIGLAKSEFEGDTGRTKSKYQKARKDTNGVMWWYILIDKKLLFYKPPLAQKDWYAPRARNIYERDSKLYYVGKTKHELIDLNDSTIELRDGKMEVNGHIYDY